MHRYLQDAPAEKAFILGDRRIASIYSMVFELSNMDDATYARYAGAEFNYFADWVEKVIGYNWLGHKLRKAESRQKAITALEDSIRNLEEVDKEHAVVRSALISPKGEKTEKEAKHEPKTPDEVLREIAKNERQIKAFLWKHFTWDMTLEFIYGMGVGIVVGIIIGKMLFG